MSLYHSICGLLTRLGSSAVVTSEVDGQQAEILGLIQNDNSRKSVFDFAYYFLRGKNPGHLYVLLGTPDIPFDLDKGARVTQNARNYQILAHKYFFEGSKKIYLFALLTEEVEEA